MKKKVFLSGPMRGMVRADALKWRSEAAQMLSLNFDVVHAMRGREENETFTNPRAAVARDLSDIKACDILLVNDTVADASMIGTSMEVFFAFQQNKPVVVFGNAHDKDYWLNYHTHLRVSDLACACDVLNKLFA